MNRKEVAERLGINEKTEPGRISLRHGVFTYRRGFFYRIGCTPEKLAADVAAKIPTAVIIDKGTVIKPFRGSAPLVKSSHWFVKFTVPAKS